MSNKDSEGCVNEAFTDNETAVTTVDSEEQTYPITSKTEPIVIPEHSEGQAHPVISKTELTVISEHPEGQAHPVTSRTEPTAITVDREGQANPITSMTGISVNCSETPVVHSVTESADSSHENHGIITTSDTREVNNIVYNEQTEVDGQDSQKKYALNTELQITESVQTSIDTGKGRKRY